MQHKQIYTRAVGLLLAVGLMAGCGGYEPVSPEAYEYTKALYSVCNRRNASRLTSVAELIETARVESLLTATEAAWLDEIVATAEAGDWKLATRDARRLMEAQVVKN